MDPVVAAIYAQGREVGVAVLAPRARSGKGDAARRSLQIWQFLEEEGFVWTQSVLTAQAVQHVYLADTLMPAEQRRLQQA
jgi:hypothetical protein